ncbi:MAG: hypothetical protein ABJA82_17435 [Myxococcales bacterium]
MLPRLVAVILIMGGCAKVSTATQGATATGGAGASGGPHATAGASGGHPAVDGPSGTRGHGNADAAMGGQIVFDAEVVETGSTMSDGAGIINDARIEVDAVCVPDAGTSAPGPLARRCAAPTVNECDGHTDINSQLPNGHYGNGFDDDCDGKVDEGCPCGPAHPGGTTKTCWLVSSTQVDPTTMGAVGWCAQNSVGTLTCRASNDEFQPSYWDGECRGAQPPFADDICAPGDFDCDGIEHNSRTQDCRCKVDVQCPTDPIVTKPFPDPKSLSPIDGSPWVGMGLTASNWSWTVTGGDCDNILPHPTFAVYGQQSATRGGPRLSGNRPQTGLGPNGNQQGFVVGPATNVGPLIYPAFSLSGDYLVKGEWDDPTGHHSCTVKVQVRSPGLRVELCWNKMPVDLDLHLARLQSPKTCTHGWFQTCSDGADRDDCYYDSDCQRGFMPNPSPWGYARSPAASCQGWGSSRIVGTCDNPRLDQDNIDCDPAIADPMNMGDMLGGFCTAENINIDNPKDGDKFVVGVQYYDAIVATSPPRPQPHVNIYCNGERRLAFGFDPTAMPATTFPVLRDSGADAGGDLWEVATVEAKVTGGDLADCIITPIRSKVPKPTKDGSSSVCVDTNPQNSATMLGANRWKFATSGGYPATADAFCWH